MESRPPDNPSASGTPALAHAIPASESDLAQQCGRVAGWAPHASDGFAAIWPERDQPAAISLNLP